MALANRIWPVCGHIHFEDGFGVEEADRQFRRRVVLRRIALSGNSRWWCRPDPARHRSPRLEARREAGDLRPQRRRLRSFAAPPDPDYRRRLKADPGMLLIGTVAALRPEKNIARLIRSVAPSAARSNSGW